VVRKPRGGGTADWYACRREITRVAVVLAISRERRRAAPHSAWRPTLRHTASSRCRYRCFSCRRRFAARGNDGFTAAEAAAGRHRRYRNCGFPTVAGGVAAAGRRHRVRVHMQIRTVHPRTVLLWRRQVLRQRVQPLVLVVSDYA